MQKLGPHGLKIFIKALGGPDLDKLKNSTTKKNKVRKKDDPFGKKYAQIYKKGGLVAKKKFIARACGKVMNKRRKLTKIY